MKNLVNSCWRIATFVFGALALFAFAAALFVFISDDFVIRGQVVPATDAKFVAWRNYLCLAGLASGALAWFSYRWSRK